MSKRQKGVDGQTPTRRADEGADAQGEAARPKKEARAWATVAKLPGGGNKIDARRNAPSGPLGGSGRKTNLSRSL